MGRGSPEWIVPSLVVRWEEKYGQLALKVL